jgi:NAD(P)H-nitrite reductase large subunit
VSKVDRCVCFNKTFAALKQVADKTSAKTVQELQRHIDFGFSCLLCVPYVERMLATGEVEFPVGGS